MVLDNADDVEVVFNTKDAGATTPVTGNASFTLKQSISDYLPSSPKGSILITTRSQEVAQGLIEDAENILEVKSMSAKEATTLLTEIPKIGRARYEPR